MVSLGLKWILKEIWFTFLGAFIILVLLPIYLVICVPFIIYRYIICKWIAPLKGTDFGKAVTSFGNGMAVEFLKANENIQPRWSIVTCLVFEGNIPLDEVKEQVSAKWILSRNEKTSDLKYPEFQQYNDQWMWLMFWKKDKDFHLKNHVFSHEGKSEQELDMLVEDLLMKPYEPRRSPWEIHVVQDYYDEEFRNLTDKSLTVFLLRSHHALADGMSIMSALVEGLFEIPSDKFSFAQPGEKMKMTLRNKILNRIQLPLKVSRDFGLAINHIARQNRELFHFQKRIKTNQIYGKSKLIPIYVVKDTKNKLGVSFTTVLLSSIGAGLSKILELRGGKYEGERIIFGTTLPLPNHPDKMRNHVTGTAIHLLLKSDMRMDLRVLDIEKSLNEAKQTLIPVILPVLAKITSFHVAPIMRQLARNTAFPAGLSNFPGPMTQHNWRGRTMLGGHFATSTGVGSQGMVFTVLSYNGYIRIALTAEEEVLSREEVNILLDYAYQEIHRLHDYSLRIMPSAKQYAPVCEENYV